MYTDDNGIVRFESLDNIAPLQVGLNAALESVSDSLTDTNERIDVLEYDSGWVQLTYASGFSAGTPGQLEVRRVGDVVNIRGGATGSFPAGSYAEVISPNMPAQFRPSAIYRTGTFGTGMRGYCGIEIGASGIIKLGWSNGGKGLSAPSWISAGCTYMVG